MPNVSNHDPSEKLEKGVVLSVSGAGSENEAVLAVENYLRVNRKEHLELAIPEKREDGIYEIRLE